MVRIIPAPASPPPDHAEGGPVGDFPTDRVGDARTPGRRIDR